MDANLNAVEPAWKEKLYFQKKSVEEGEEMSIWTRAFRWNDAANLLGAENPDPEVVEKMRYLHIAEFEWSKCSKEEDVSVALGFWNWVREILNVGGKYVEELTVEFVHCEDWIIRKACFPLKIAFLESLPKLCENAKAVRFIGDGLIFSKSEARKDFETMGRKGGFTKLEAAEIAFEMTDSHMGRYLNDKILAGSPIQSLTVCSEQLLLAKEDQVLQNVVSLRLGNFGAEYNNKPDFVDLIVRLFPNVEKLRLYDCFCDVVHDLPVFVNRMSARLPLKVFGVDQSFFGFLGESKEKINDVETIELNVASYLTPSINFLKQVRNCEQVVLTGWKTEGLEQLRNDVIVYLKNEIKTCKKVILETTEASIAEIGIAE